jgi:hypothetical protein
MSDVLRHGPPSRPPFVGWANPPTDIQGPPPRDPCYSYQWWSQAPQLAIDFLAPNLLLTVLAAATPLPIGQDYTARPDVYQVPIAVQWQAPFNPVLTTLTQAVTITSADVSELPPAQGASRVPLDVQQGRNFQQFAQVATAPVGEGYTDRPQPVSVPIAVQWQAPLNTVLVTLTQLPTLGSAQASGLQPLTEPLQWSARFELTQGRNFQQFAQPAVALPIGKSALDLPQGPPRFSPADQAANRFPLRAGEIRSARLTDLPLTPAQFQAAEVRNALFPTTPAATLRSAAVTELPPQPVRFAQADLRNPLLPPLESFTAFPFRQQDWPLPVLPPVIDRSYQQPPFVITPAPEPAVDVTPILGRGKWQATRNYIIKGKRYHGLTELQLALVLAQEYGPEIERKQVKVAFRGKKPHPVSVQTWQDILESMSVAAVREIDDDDDEAAAMLLL